MTSRGQFAQLLAPGLNEIMFDWLNSHPEEYSQYCVVKPSTRAYEDTQLIAGLPIAKLKQPGSPIPLADPVQGPTKRIIMDSYGLGWEATLEMIEDEQYDIMSQMPAELTRSAREHWEQGAANVLNLGATTVLVADGLSLFNTAHPNIGSGTTQSNRTNTDFSRTSLQDLFTQMETITDDQGRKRRLTPTDIWFHPNLQFIVKQVLGSEYEPETGNNAVNPVYNTLQPHVLHYLTSTRSSFVCDKESNYICFFWRTQPRSDVSDDPNTLGTKHTIFFRYGVDAVHWQGWAALII